MAMSAVMDHFFHCENSIGFRGSLSIHVTTYGSSSVPAPSYCHFNTSGVTRPWCLTMRQCGTD